MPKRATSDRKEAKRHTPRPARAATAAAAGPLESGLRRAEAVSVGLVHALTDTVITAVRGAQDVGAEIGSTAVGAVRGSIRAAEDIGGDLGRLARTAADGAVTATRQVGGEVGRVALEAAQTAVQAVQRAGASAGRMLGMGTAPIRRPGHKAPGRRAGRARRKTPAA
jgi:hypothetical protein